MAPRKSALSRATSTKKKLGRKRKSQAIIELGEGSNATSDGEITPTEPVKKKGRGPGLIRKLTNVVEDRPIIWPISSCEFTCVEKPKEITAAITRYRDGEDVQRCREVLEAIAAKRYSGELHEARNSCIKKFGRNIPAWKKSVPHWCLTHAYWHGLCDIFATDEWQEVSKQNHDNRTTSGLTVSHYAGCASAHQHFGKLKNLKNGEDPTMRELYIHLHCRRDNGKSPIETQLEAATPVQSGPAEITDENGVMDPNTEEIPRVIEELDVNSLQFPNTRIKAVYVSCTMYINLLNLNT
ncbi:hypothetical protein FCM35_KLT03605 [Carex littledalei]|uniref:Uncharacterized protein n=1 Tax=Carex littledalei TaxID=544730 RepID=A0A833V9W9_9POAL|nr:hypothetical protein FCM35_KLT03605 [Carex littledalei]